MATIMQHYLISHSDFIFHSLQKNNVALLNDIQLFIVLIVFSTLILPGRKAFIVLQKKNNIYTHIYTY